MPFGLTNAPASFQDMLNHSLKALLDKDVVGYIDDILIYTKTTEQQDKLVEKVLERLAKNDLSFHPNNMFGLTKRWNF
jgi:hypothetical protein